MIQSRYLGTKRFSSEGVTSLIPFLDEVLNCAADREAKQVVLAMSHRGRLNVIVNIMGRDPSEIFAKFEDVDPRSTLGGGDVKYHIGATGMFTGRNGTQVKMHLVLEIPAISRWLIPSLSVAPAPSKIISDSEKKASTKFSLS